MAIVPMLLLCSCAMSLPNYYDPRNTGMFEEDEAYCRDRAAEAEDYWIKRFPQGDFTSTISARNAGVSEYKKCMSGKGYLKA